MVFSIVVLGFELERVGVMLVLSSWRNFFSIKKDSFF